MPSTSPFYRWGNALRSRNFPTASPRVAELAPCSRAARPLWSSCKFHAVFQFNCQWKPSYVACNGQFVCYQASGCSWDLWEMKGWPWCQSALSFFVVVGHLAFHWSDDELPRVNRLPVFSFAGSVVLETDRAGSQACVLTAISTQFPGTTGRIASGRIHCSPWRRLELYSPIKDGWASPQEPRALSIIQSP